MFIAKQKRKENIAEYILYLWQLEDLLRALEFSPEAIRRTLVDPYENLDAAARHDLLNWYLELADLLRSEGKTQAGHLEHTLHLVADLNDLHGHLLKAPVGRQYAALFASVEPELIKLRVELSSERQVSDVELCLMALYSVMLCRMKGEDGSPYVRDVLEVIAPVMALLAAIYQQAEDGKIDLYQEE